MTKNFLSKDRVTSNCTHESQMRIEIAGMSREVCESCGKVSVAYIEDHFQPERVQEVEEAIRSFGERSSSSA